MFAMNLVKYNKAKKIIALMAVYESYIKFLKAYRLSRTKRTRPWTRFVYSENERQLHGFFNKLFSLIKSNDTDEFRKATRMGIKEFMLLNQLLNRKIKKEDFIRQSILPECRLALTLVYLGHGVSRQMLAKSFRVGVSTVRSIILETCEAIWAVLEGIYLAQPNVTEWRNIADDFYEKTGLPNVAGAIDGKRIAIKCPPKSRSQQFNYKKYSNIVLLAACDSHYTFTAIDIGAYGSQNDRGVLRAEGFGNAILQEKINMPKSKPLPLTNEKFPLYFIGDAAFPLKRNIMRPYPGRHLSPDKENFNKMFSRSRVRIENTFGIATARWKVLCNALNVFPENAEKIVKAVVVLHNFVKFHDSANYCPENYVDEFTETDELIEGRWRQEVAPLPQSKLFTHFNAAKTAFSIRDLLKDYLYTHCRPKV